MLLRFCRLQQQPLIQDQRYRVCVFGHGFLVAAITSGNIQIQEEIREPDIHGFVSLLTGFHSERAGKIRFAASFSSGNKQISVLRDILTACQPPNQFLVELSPGSVIDVSDKSFGLVEAGIVMSLFRPLLLRLLYSMSTSMPKRSSKGIYLTDRRVFRTRKYIFDYCNSLTNIDNLCER